MDDLSRFAYIVSFVALGAAALMYVSYALAQRRLALAGGSVATEARPAVRRVAASLGRWGTMLSINAFVFLTGALAFRWAAAGHGPFSNMYEFSLSFAWGALAVHLYFEFRYGLRALAVLVLPVCLAMLAYAATLPSDIDPLVPALQNDVLLTLHVAVAVAAYGAFALSFAAAVLFLVNRHDRIRWLPRRALLDEVGYKAVMFGFPMMALVIILGAVWAEVAWGQYWSWDPKETASLVTWLLYGGYLHARVVRGWKGERSAYLLIGGFAAVLFTYFGNYFFGGLHSYG
ncbi:MAG TPA: c-type cytochrome biogenesis protein CcsB [Dehalococcoidia bacterium]|nr:c-type cytochrome biogenesis protein CcsB [Dehalococcoidia bacterium]